jgi:hypothetical protein
MSFVIRNGTLFLDTHERIPLCSVPFRSARRFATLEEAKPFAASPWANATPTREIFRVSYALRWFPHDGQHAYATPSRGFCMRLRDSARFETPEKARAAHLDRLFHDGSGFKVVRVLTRAA